MNIKQNVHSKYFTEEDSRWMKIAINYARHGVGLTSKNPSVGCVIIKNNQLIGVGRTSNGGRPHAEENALIMAGKNSNGAFLYVTLEPCAHHEDFVPCMKKIVRASIQKVVIACQDPDKRTNGKAIKYLLDNNINVTIGCLNDEANELIEGYNKRICFGRPYITSKIASSLDSNIALLNGESKCITGLNTRKYVHLQRLRNDGILTGINTINNDDAKLDCRIKGLEEFSPIVFILDSNLKIDLKSKILKRNNIFIITSSESSQSKRKILIEKGIKIKILETDKNNIISIKSILDFLNELKINNLLIEAGSIVNTFFLKNKLIDKIILCRSGIVLGSDAQSFFNEINLQTIPKKAIYKLCSSFQIDDDVIEEWKINN